MSFDVDDVVYLIISPFKRFLDSPESIDRPITASKRDLQDLRRQCSSRPVVAGTDDSLEVEEGWPVVEI